MADELKPRRLARTGLYARSPSALQVRAERVRRLVVRMRKTMPWLEPSDTPAARAWAELEILGAHAFAELEKNGLLNANGDPRRLFTDLLRLRQVQVTYARELGMTPAARVALKAHAADVALDIVGRFARGDVEGDPDEGQSSEPEKEKAGD